MSLKELTKEVHKQAERQDFVHELMSGKMSDEMYAKFLWNQHAIYNLLGFYFNIGRCSARLITIEPFPIKIKE